MTDRIEPALTAKVWADWARDPERFVMLRGDVIGEDALQCAEIIAYNNAALPDSDPRKITRETVNALRAAYLEFGQTNEKTDRILAIADALESFLPPE